MQKTKVALLFAGCLAIGLGAGAFVRASIDKSAEETARDAKLLKDVRIYNLTVASVLGSDVCFHARGLDRDLCFDEVESVLNAQTEKYPRIRASFSSIKINRELNVIRGRYRL